MEEKVYEAATSGSTTTLQEALDKDPLVLDRFVSTCFGSSPLHIAAFRGHTEILHRNPELADAVDSCHRSPLHLASARGHLQIVEELLLVDPDLCLAWDRDGRNPFHLAVMKGVIHNLVY